MSVEAKLETITIKSLIEELKNKEEGNKLDLSPIYQRDVVWSGEMQSNFIESLIKGYVPSNIIINKASDRWTCMDGKQRLTSILLFYNNKISYIVNEIEHVYYSNAPDTEEESRALDPIERTKLFDDRKLNMVYYSDLPFETQVDIFNRIQYGMITSDAERLRSNFKNSQAALTFKNFISQTSDLFDNPSRDKHMIFVLDFMFMIYKNELYPPTKASKTKFLKHLDNSSNMKHITESTLKPLEAAFSKKIFRSLQLSKLKMTKNFKLGVAYLIKENFDLNLIFESKINSTFIKNVRLVISNTWGKWNIEDNKLRTKKDKMSMTKIKKLFDIEYSNIFDEDDVDDVDENLDVSSSNSESIEQIKVKKKTIARLKAKVNKS